MFVNRFALFQVKLSDFHTKIHSLQVSFCFLWQITHSNRKFGKNAKFNVVTLAIIKFKFFLDYRITTYNISERIIKIV